MKWGLYVALMAVLGIVAIIGFTYEFLVGLVAMVVLIAWASFVFYQVSNQTESTGRKKGRGKRERRRGPPRV